MIREALGKMSFPSGGWGSVTPSPAANEEKRKGMDWDRIPGATQEKSRMDKLGGMLGNVGSALGHHLGLHDHKEQGEIMIGMFMHTPWPSSEIFRCLPSEHLRGKLD